MSFKGVEWKIETDNHEGTIILTIGKVTHVMGPDPAQSIGAGLLRAGKELERVLVLRHGAIVGKLH